MRGVATVEELTWRGTVSGDESPKPGADKPMSKLLNSRCPGGEELMALATQSAINCKAGEEWREVLEKANKSRANEATYDK